MPASIVNQVVNLHRAQLQGIIELGGVRKVRKLYEQARSELEDKLSELKKAGKDATFTAHHARMVLLQVRDGLSQFQQQFVPALAKQGKASATLAQRHTVSAIKKFESRFTGTQPVLQIEEAGVFARVYRGIEPSLLDRYHKYTRNYPLPTIKRIRNNLAMSMLKNEGVQQAVDRIAGAGGIFAREKWRAERIVRTESSYAYGISQQRCLEETAQEVPRLMKRMISTFDGREGEDAVEQHLQTVPVTDYFIWHKQTKQGVQIVRYQNPPSRPNDRAVVIPWRSDYHSREVEAGPIEPRMPSADLTTGL